MSTISTIASAKPSDGASSRAPFNFTNSICFPLLEKYRLAIFGNFVATLTRSDNTGLERGTAVIRRHLAIFKSSGS